MLIVTLIMFILGLLMSRSLRKRIKEAREWDPFGWKVYMTTAIKCSKCGWEKSRLWARGDFVGKEVDVRAVYPKSKLGKHKKCDGKVFITGIYWERKMTKEEEKYNELCRKWGNPEGIYV